MGFFGTGAKASLWGSTLLFGCSLLAGRVQAAQFGGSASANAASQPNPSLHGPAVDLPAMASFTTTVPPAMHVAGKRSITRSYSISCVPYARQVSGIMVTGNAWQWWNNATGVYARGDRPEPGSVLNFRPNGRMHLGHVAVVAQVVNPREVIVDHANWPSGEGYGAVSRHVAVVDVSAANNWSAVRVELARSGTFGSVYPTYGFIYKRPDTGLFVANVARPAPQPDINPVPSDLRPVAERPWRMIEEVAESPDAPARRIGGGTKPHATMRLQPAG
jgi:surface antigen